MNTTERTIRVNAVDLHTQVYGDRRCAAVLLIAPVGESMLDWAEKFCVRLAAAGRFVIRYDHRDTGRSTSFAPGAPEYTFGDLVADAIGVLDHFGLSTAHIVGRSTGGMVAQLAALGYADRVASLTVVSTRPVGPGPADPDLPESDPGLVAELAELPEPDWADRAAVVDFLVARDRRLAAKSRAFDEAGRRALAGRVVTRSRDIEAALANPRVVYGRDRWRDRLGEIVAPTLVVHGLEDRLFPYGNAIALSREIRAAELLPLERTGHELPPATWGSVLPAIVRHTADRGRRAGTVRRSRRHLTLVKG